MYEYKVEYGVIHARKWADEGLHRGPYDTEAEAQSFVDEWLLDGGKADVLIVVTRTVAVESWVSVEFRKKWTGGLTSGNPTS